MAKCQAADIPNLLPDIDTTYLAQASDPGLTAANALDKSWQSMRENMAVNSHTGH